MKTKIFAVLALYLAIAQVGFAQKTTLGVRGGVNFTNLNGEDNSGDDLDYKIKTGFNVGINAEIPVGTDFYLQPGVLFSQKGAKFNDDLKLNLSYIEVPINFIYKPELGTGKMLLGFGPYFGVAVGGSYKPDSGDDIDVKFKSKVSTADLISGTPYLRRYDAGGNLLVGYEFANNFSLQLNAQLGLVKINPDIEGTDDDGKVKNTGFGVSVGYRF